MRILGIESSCDETGVAIFDSHEGLMSNVLYSQIERHREFGGVVPELASRDHAAKLLPLVHQALKEANTTQDQLDGIAYTRGPGLAGALLVGSQFAKSFAFARQIPALGVHHLEGHLLAPLIDDPSLKPPFVALLVSGGHTLLAAVDKLGSYRILGDTLDDAAGEAFDKSAKLLGLPYPGGPELAKLAGQGVTDRFDCPRPLLKHPNCDFSFSGLKTHVARLVASLPTPLSNCDKADVAASFEAAVVDVLYKKSLRALKETGYSTIVIAGGVSANQHLRQTFQQGAKAHHFNVSFPRPALCTDNAAMIAFAGHLRMTAGEKDPDDTLSVKPRWPLAELSPI